MNVTFNDGEGCTLDLHVIGDHSTDLPYGVHLAVSSEPPSHILRVYRATSLHLCVSSAFLWEGGRFVRSF